MSLAVSDVKPPKTVEAVAEPETPIIEAPVTPQPAPKTTEDIVREAARKYGVDENYFVHIAQCESTLNPSAVNYNYYENGHPSGLFQHLSGYYPARAEKYGYSTDVFDAYSNANTTAAMFSEGLSYLWQCQ